MQHYPITAYQPNQVPWVENEDLGWGPYHWPQGVPAHLMGLARTQDGTTVQVRKELVPLFQALIDISEQVYGYPIHRGKAGGFTGGYENRAIAGTNTASAHSRARTIDVRAVDNPQSWTFISTWPPELMSVWQSCGFYWGGLYTGVRHDTMHLTYCRPPSGVAADLATARSVLAAHKIQGHPGGTSAPAKPAPAKPAPVKPAPSSKRPGIAVITLPGLSVRRLQIAMICAGAPHIAVDGKMGPATTGDVDWCQRYGGVDEDRYVGPDTWTAIGRGVVKHYPLPGDQVFGTVAKVLNGVSWAKRTRSGDRRYDDDTIRYWIRLYQLMLQERRWAPSIASAPRWADGVFEQPTDAATCRAQRALGLGVDGMAGRETWPAVMAGRV